MRTSHSSDTPRLHGSPGGSLPRGIGQRRLTSAERRLDQALADLKRLKEELASSARRTRAAERQAEDRCPVPEQRGSRDFDMASALMWCSTWRAIDQDSSLTPDPSSAGGGEQIVWASSRVPKGRVLYRAGDRLRALYVVRFGACKTVLQAKSGQEQVVAFPIVGDLVGADGIGFESHTCQTTALEDTEVIRLPMERIEQFERRDPAFAHKFHKLLSQEYERAHTLLLVVGSMRAEQRLAFFLLELSQRYQARGYSSREYVLRMSRQEIGSYLGLKLETVSRAFSRFQREGVLQIAGRTTVLQDPAWLARLADGR